jgi:hypothetical protein
MYFKSLEMSPAYLNFKQQQKAKRVEELTMMKSMISQDFSQIYYAQEPKNRNIALAKFIKPVVRVESKYKGSQYQDRISFN